MHLNRRFLLMAATLAFIAPSVGVPAAEPAYVTALQLDLVPFLSNYPVDGSQQARADMLEVLALQASRTPARAAQSKTDSQETVEVMFASLIGPDFSFAKLPMTEALVARVGESEDATVDPIKKIYGRLRPFMANPDVHPSAVISRSGSYPSGHATRVTAMGIVLAAMLPEKRDAIWARMDDYAESRLIGGVHYRSDIEAGRSAGIALAAAIFTQAAFRADYAPARGELRHALGM